MFDMTRLHSELIPGVAEAIRLINESGYLCIVVTNQPVMLAARHQRRN